MIRLLLVTTLVTLILSLSVSAGEAYVISASPGLPREESEKVFSRLSTVLSEITGKQFAYRHPGNWSSYIDDMRESRYDLLFDEPHMVSWRVENLQHVPIVKLAGQLNYVVVTRERDEAIIQLKDLAGYTVCTHSPPMMDSLILYAQFDNPSRQPRVRRIKSPKEGYTDLLEHNCRGAVLPARLYENLSAGKNETRILYLSKPFPQWALSADPDIPEDLLTQIRDTVLTPENGEAVRKLIDEVDIDPGLLPATGSDYIGYSSLLKNFWAFR